MAPPPLCPSGPVTSRATSAGDAGANITVTVYRDHGEARSSRAPRRGGAEGHDRRARTPVGARPHPARGPGDGAEHERLVAQDPRARGQEAGEGREGGRPDPTEGTQEGERRVARRLPGSRRRRDRWRRRGRLRWPHDGRGTQDSGSSLTDLSTRPPEGAGAERRARLVRRRRQGRRGAAERARKCRAKGLRPSALLAGGSFLDGQTFFLLVSSTCITHCPNWRYRRMRGGRRIPVALGEAEGDWNPDEPVDHRESMEAAVRTSLTSGGERVLTRRLRA